MRGNRPSGTGTIPLDGEDPLVVPVISAAGGVGRSTVAAILAAALHHQTTDSWGRAVGVCDASPRGASPWLEWLDHTAERGTGWLATCTADPELFARELRRSTSALEAGDGRAIWVLTDTGAIQPEFSGADPTPQFWAPALRYLRAAIIDADPLEAFRLARQRAGGQHSAAAAWMAAPAVRTTALWVTDPSPVGLARTLEAMTAAEQCGLPMHQFVVAINDHRGHGWTPRSRSRRTLLADRVGAIVEIGHDAALRKDGRPCYSASLLSRRDIAALVTAVLGAAGRAPGRPADPATAPAPAPATAPAPAPATAPALTAAPEAMWPATPIPAALPDPASAFPERTPRHVAASARAVPASR